MKTNALALLLVVIIYTPYIKSQEPNKSTVTDIEGNIYQTTVIGNYEWMTENLRTTTYSNGDRIPIITQNNEWIEIKSAAFCWYNNEETNAKKFGALYNWYAVNTSKLCPIGWRVPTDEEWKYLEGFADTKYGLGDPIWNSIGGRGNDVGIRLKATSGWGSGNGSNTFGFNAIPGGERASRGRFLFKGVSGFYWSSSETDVTSAKYRCMINFIENIIRNNHPKFMGFSVRCLKDK